MHALRRWLRTPKGIFALMLLACTVPAAAAAGWRLVTPGLVAAILTAGALDAPLLRWRRGKWTLPDGAFLTGWLVALVLSPHEPWTHAAATAALAIGAKHLWHAGRANVLNPAAAGLVASYHLLDTGQSWWGALPELSPLWLHTALLAGGIYITNRVNKLPLVLSFLGAYFCLFTATAFVGDPRHVAEIFRTPDINAVIYFSLVILTDPPTSPAKYPGQWVFGIIVATASYAVFMLFGVAYFLLAGVLAGNAWEAWRRMRRRGQTAGEARSGAGQLAPTLPP